jgi:allophanate hydrolase
MTVWIHRRSEPVPAGALRLAVKDNIDVAGMPTTAGCPAFSYSPEVSAPVVTRLEAAGAVVVGKTALDQFATGLVGTRSPWGPLSSPLAPDHVSGGSSSGSAVAVATGEADIALGTDTAGSGRVPAALCGIVGLKPTVGWLPVAGVVPACRSFDCVSVFARDVATAARAVEAAGDPQPAAAVRPVRRIGVPAPSVLAAADDEGSAAWAALDLTSLGYEVVEVDLDAYLAAGRLLYDGALVAERHAAIAGQPAPPLPDGRDDAIRLAVCGAHLEGQPLNHQLTARGARLVARTATAPTYRMVALPTDPPKPGLVRVAAGGAAIEVEVWALDPAGFGSFVAEVPAPLAIGTVVLADGSSVMGFTCEGIAAADAPDITVHGGWRAYLASR